MTQSMKKLLNSNSFKRATFTFSVNTAPGWRLSTALAAVGITKKARVLIVIEPGIYVGGLIIDSAPAGSLIKLINNGNIIGASGSGAGLVIGVTTSITNNGMIAGGGGNGGNGGAGRNGYLDNNRTCVIVPMAAGNGGRGAGMSGTTVITEALGTAGQAATESPGKGGRGGNGGEFGKAGTAGGPGISGNSWQGGTLLDADGQARYYPACGPYNSGVFRAGAVGGAAGKAIQGIAFVKYVTKGNIVGPVS